jgi:nicotinamidase-related amidase
VVPARLDIALRDCGVNAFIIVGIATEIGIEPTVRHGADLGYVPIIVTDACGAGSLGAARAHASHRRPPSRAERTAWRADPAQRAGRARRAR